MWTLLALAACGPAPIRDVTLEEGVARGTAEVRFTTRLSGEAFVRFTEADDDVEDPVYTETARVDAASGRVLVVGLPRNEVEYEVVLVDDRGREHRSQTQRAPVSGPVGSVLAFEQTVWAPDEACDPGGAVLLSYLTGEQNGIGLVDRAGRWLYSLERPAVYQIGRVRAGRDGRSLLFNLSDTAKAEDVGVVERIDLLGRPLSTTRTVWGHHDFVETPEGDIAWLGYDLRDVEAPPNTPPRDNPEITGTVCIAADTLVVGPEGGLEGDETVLWDTWEDYPPGVDHIPTDSISCGRDGCEPAFLRNGCYEYGHANSLARVDSEGAYYFNLRWLDAAMKASEAGDLQWVWGGAGSDFALDPATAFEGMHFSEVRPGRLLAFDNRNPDVGSRVVEYAFDDTGYRQVWEHEDPDGTYEHILGDARWFPIEGCDNVLVSWSGQGKLQELTPAGKVVWELQGTGTTSRVTWVPDVYDLSGLAYPE
ncbi:MAG: hypothetical protein R3F59_25385 [Myxococcota bacterium]